MLISRRKIFAGLSRLTAIVGIAAISSVAIAAPASAQTKITVGRTNGASGFHIPYFVAMDRGFFKAEGLDASFIAMSGKALVTAGLGGSIDFVPIPTGGAQASLRGAKIKFIVNGSLISQWTLVTPPSITSVAQLKGKTCGFGRPGSADYDEGEIVLRQHFDMHVGRDYKVISFQGEADVLAALINGSVSCGLLTFPHAAKAMIAGLHILLRTGDYLPRIGPCWVTEAYFEKNKDTVRRFIRAVAKAEQYVADNKAGTVPVIQKYFGIKNPKEAGFIWDQIHNEYGPDIPFGLFRAIYDSRLKALKSAGLWPKDKPMPNLHALIARDMLTDTLRGMGYYLQRPPKIQGRLH